jgi:hypothetical protein
MVYHLGILSPVFGGWGVDADYCRWQDNICLERTFFKVARVKPEEFLLFFESNDLYSDYIKSFVQSRTGLGRLLLIAG